MTFYFITNFCHKVQFNIYEDTSFQIWFCLFVLFFFYFYFLGILAFILFVNSSFHQSRLVGLICLIFIFPKHFKFHRGCIGWEICNVSFWFWPINLFDLWNLTSLSLNYIRYFENNSDRYNIHWKADSQINFETLC